MWVLYCYLLSERGVVVKNSNEHRRVIDDKFIKALSSEGILFPVTELVKEHRNELFMAFRRSYINIYYLGHSIYKIEQQKTGYAVTFNFNHARYSEDHVDLLKDLLKLGMELPTRRSEPQIKRLVCDRIDADGKTVSGSNTITKKITCGNKPDKKFWDESYAMLKRIVDDFYNKDKRHDYFKDEDYVSIRKEKGLPDFEPERDKNPLIEKQHQQKITLANRFSDNGYFVYDMEYAQPNEKQGDKKSGRFDMLALKIENHKATQLLFIELKSTLSACGGASGIEKHKNDMVEYLARKDVIEARKKDAEGILDAYNKLFQVGKVDFSEFYSKGPGFAIVLTDEALEYKGEYMDQCNMLDGTRENEPQKDESWIMKGLIPLL